MSFVSTSILAFSMSADAFAVALSKGSVVKKAKFFDSLRIGVIFGMMEAVTPLIGWAVGSMASGFIQDVDHWVAFILLGLIGLKMIFSYFKNEENIEEKKSKTFGVLLLTAFATSVDAMAVGVGLAFVNINIWMTALAIGIATCCMVTIGMMTGHYLGRRVGRVAEALGGIGLILIGTNILLTHLQVI